MLILPARAQVVTLIRAETSLACREPQILPLDFGQTSADSCVQTTTRERFAAGYSATLGPRLDGANRRFSLSASVDVFDTMDMNTGATVAVTLGISVSNQPVPYRITFSEQNTHSIGAQSKVEIQGVDVIGSYTASGDQLNREGMLPPGEHVLTVVFQVIGNGVVGAPATAAASGSFGLEFGKSELYAILLGKFSGLIDGSGDSERIRKALLQFPGVKPENLSIVTSSSEVTDKFIEIRQKIRSGDAFMFFYSGHGGVREDNSELPFEYDIQASRLMTRTQNTGDEYLAINHTRYTEPNADFLTDDELKNLFGFLPRDVSKLAVLGSCFSGGFWGQGGANPPDTGDLEKVPSTGLLAAATEGGLAFSAPLAGTFLMKSVERALNSLARTQSSFSFSDLRSATAAAYVNGEFPTRGVVSDNEPWLDGEMAVEEEVGPLSLFATTTEDFDRKTPLTGSTPRADGTLSARLIDGVLHLNLLTNLEKRYVVETTVDLNSPVWVELTNFLGTGAIIDHPLPIEPGSAHQYFRVR